MIYLDSASTAKYNEADEVVVDAMINAMRKYWKNPSSLYVPDVKKEIDKCRENIANFIGAEYNEIFFTSCASESNNWAIRGWVDYMKMNTLKPINVITTPIEHKSILGAVQNGMLGAYVYYCDVDRTGLVDYESLEHLLMICNGNPILASICMANNEVGTIQDIKEISDLVHKYNGVLHVDATQALPHIPINVKKLGIDMLSASGHKISTVLKGIGFLYKSNDVDICPLIYGAQENGLRGGTENVFGIIGLSKAIEYYDSYFNNVNTMYDKRDYFIDLLRTKFGCKLNGHSEHRLPNNINVTFPQNITGESLLYALDMSGIQISVGSACNSHSIEPSHVLKTIGLTDEEAMKTIRISLPNDITYDDIDYAIDEIYKAIRIIES